MCLLNVHVYCCCVSMLMCPSCVYMRVFSRENSQKDSTRRYGEGERRFRDTINIERVLSWVCLGILWLGLYL